MAHQQYPLLRKGHVRVVALYRIYDTEEQRVKEQREQRVCQQCSHLSKSCSLCACYQLSHSLRLNVQFWNGQLDRFSSLPFFPRCMLILLSRRRIDDMVRRSTVSFFRLELIILTYSPP